MAVDRRFGIEHGPLFLLIGLNGKSINIVAMQGADMIRSQSLRLMVFVAAVAFTSELLSNSILHVAIKDVLVPLLQEVSDPASSSLWFNIVSQIISLTTGPVLIFTATYLRRTPYDLRREYKTLIILKFSGALLGYMIGAIIWLGIALVTGIYEAAPNTTLESFYLPFWLPLQTLHSLSKSVHYVFVAFTALAISHIRRSPNPSDTTARG